MAYLSLIQALPTQSLILSSPLKAFRRSIESLADPTIRNKPDELASILKELSIAAQQKVGWNAPFCFEFPPICFLLLHIHTRRTLYYYLVFLPFSSLFFNVSFNTTTGKTKHNLQAWIRFDFRINTSITKRFGSRVFYCCINESMVRNNLHILG
jgi:hypothetical protein